MKKTAAADVVIFGGGIAGLWLLNRLRKMGLATLLFESNALGAGQTQKSQGIIHGGMKYALQGVLTKDAKAITEMPDRFRQCLAGVGEIDLSHVPILSSKQYLWSTSRLASKLTAFFANAALSGNIGRLDKSDYPSVFQTPQFKGEVYALDEMVVDVPVLVRELVKDNQDAIFHIEPIGEEGLKLNEQGEMTAATVYQSGAAVEVSAQYFIFTAGAGNEVIIRKLPFSQIAMQRRPLHMVLAKTPFHYPLYAHCLGMGPRPRITITTHYTQAGGAVWYLGGQIAEDGVGRDQQSQIKVAKKELRILLPWIDFSAVEFASFMVDRAEPKQALGLKPETVFAKMIQNVIIGWPTKLALAPKLAEDIIASLKAKSISPQFFDIRELRAWPMPPLAQPIWEEIFCKNVA